MSRKSGISFELKVKYVQEYLSGKKRTCEICDELNIVSKSFHQWVHKYNLHGAEGLRKITKNTHYSTEIKHLAVEGGKTIAVNLRYINVYQ